MTSITPWAKKYTHINNDSGSSLLKRALCLAPKPLFFCLSCEALAKKDFLCYYNNMIATISGTITTKKDKFIIVETNNGVGYKVFLSKNSILNLPEINSNIKLKIICAA